MASGLNLTTIDAALKTLYSSDKIEEMAYTNRPLLAMLDKFENFTGRNMQIPIIVENPMGRSATFSNAQNRSTSTSSQISDFLITRASDYGVVTVDGETIDATADDAGAFLDAVEVEMDGMLNALANSCHVSLYHTGFGDIGVAGTFSSGTTNFTLQNVDDVVNFSIGQELGSAATTTGTPRSLAGSFGAIVVQVNRSNGIVSCSAPIDTTITSFAQGDTLFVVGDRDSTGTAKKVTGLLGWLPPAGPTATAFFGVNRTSDATRLAGIAYDGRGIAIEEALLKASALAFREGGNPDTIFMSPTQYNNLVTALGSKVQYVNVDTTVGVGFEGIKIQGQGGTLTVVPDPKCPNAYAFVLDLSKWKLYSAGKVPHIIEQDGLTTLRQATADGIEIRAVYRAQLACRAPGHNVVVQLA